MKWLLALAFVSLTVSCSTKPWMVGSYNDVGCWCTKKGMGRYKEPAPIVVNDQGPVEYSGKSGGKVYRDVAP